VERLSTIDQAGTESLQQGVDRGFEQLLEFFSKDTGAASAAEPKIQFKSAFISPRFEFDLQGSVAEKSDDVTWVRTYGGVYALQNSTFTSSPLR
jgi:hypothetical protein